MQLVDGSLSHPIRPPSGGSSPPPAPGSPVVVPTAAPTSTWLDRVPSAPPTPNEAVKVGSDAVARVVEVERLDRDPRTQLIESPTPAFLQNVLGYAPVVEALSHGSFLHTDKSDGIRTNMLLAAVDLCFQAHIPFGLRPETLWATILTQVATEVKSRPETYRSLFTTSADKETIVVRHDGLRVGVPYGWDQAIGMFADPLRAKVPSDLVDVFVPDDLSTCGTNEDLAHLIALMDAASPYYDYVVRTRCGIPKVALFGTADDWRNLSARVDRLAGSFPHLAGYFAAIRPILARITDAAGGSPVDPKFWKSIYKRDHGSGGDTLTGWLTTFYAFLTKQDWSSGQTTTALRTDFKWDHQWGGISPASFPSSVSAVDFVWDYFGTKLPMKFCGGVITSAEIDGFLTPRLGWAVVHAKP